MNIYIYGHFDLTKVDPPARPTRFFYWPEGKSHAIAMSRNPAGELKSIYRSSRATLSTLQLHPNPPADVLVKFNEWLDLDFLRI
jgi:hypothetical protein